MPGASDTLASYAEYEISRVRDYNPDTGISMVITYAAVESKIDEIQTAWAAAAEYDETALGYGYKTSKHKTAAGILLIVRVPDTILYTDRWCLNTEIVSLPIWWNEEVRQFNPKTSGLNITTAQGISDYMYRIGLLQKSVNYVNYGTLDQLFVNVDPPAGITNLGAISDEERALVFMMRRDGEYMEWKRPVLRRVRYIPVVSANRTRLVGRQNLYTTGELIDTFGVPNDVIDQIETVDTDLPAAQPNTVWAWKMRRDDSEIVIGSGKFLEQRDWVFGRWSTITHNLIG